MTEVKQLINNLTNLLTIKHLDYAKVSYLKNQHYRLLHRSAGRQTMNQGDHKAELPFSHVFLKCWCKYEVNTNKLQKKTKDKAKPCWKPQTFCSAWIARLSSEHLQKSSMGNAHILRDIAETCPDCKSFKADYSLHQNPRYVTINNINANTPKRKSLFQERQRVYHSEKQVKNSAFRMRNPPKLPLGT